VNRYLKAIKKRSQNIVDRFKNACDVVFATQQGPLYQYSQKYPDPQHALNLFKNEWISCLPAPFQHLKAGEYPLFEDARIEWAIQRLCVENKMILELGPLEGGHSYMLQKHGAFSVTAIEANPRAYLKCLMVKELMRIDKVEFLFGDFNEYLRTCPKSFDVCFASGVLYHMKNPIELLALIAERCSELFLWTHYYDPEICQNWILRSKFSAPYLNEVKGYKHTLYPYKYGHARSWSKFIGGPAKTSSWLSRKDILGALCHFGFSEIHVDFEELNSPHGPSFALVAKRK
jgi:hypothetical protein